MYQWRRNAVYARSAVMMADDDMAGARDDEFTAHFEFHIQIRQIKFRHSQLIMSKVDVDFSGVVSDVNRSCAVE